MVLAAVWLGGIERTPPPPWYVQLGFGPFLSLGAPVWIAWLVAALMVAIRPGRWARHGIGVALLLTLALVPVSALTGLARPPLFVLVPQAALGVLALAWPSSGSPWLRFVPLGLATIAGSIASLNQGFWYRPYSDLLLPAAAAILLGAALAIAMVLARRHDSRGLWATLVLLTPVGLLALVWLTDVTWNMIHNVYAPNWAALALTAVVCVGFGLAVVGLAVAGHARRSSRPAPPVGRCPTCGGPTPAGPG